MSSSLGSSMAFRLYLSIQMDTPTPTTKYRDRQVGEGYATSPGYHWLFRTGQITELRIVLDWINELATQDFQRAQSSAPATSLFESKTSSDPKSQPPRALLGARQA